MTSEINPVFDALNSLVIACHPSFILPQISFNLSPWLVLPICVATVGAICVFYLLRFRGETASLKAGLVLLRATCALALLLVIFDAAIIRSELVRSRVLVITSDLPMMRLGDAGAGKSREDEAEAFSRKLINDPQLKERFDITRANNLALTSGALDDGAQTAAAYSAVVYLTDGSDAAIQAIDQASKTLRAPLFVAHLGPDAQTPDVSISSIDCGGIAWLNAPQTINVTISGRAASGRSTLVTLSDEAIVIARAAVEWKDGAESFTVPLFFIPKIEGLHQYVVKAEAAEGELNTENNEASFSLDVRRNERRILFMENQPTWEGKFIRRALEENDSIAIDYFAQVSRAAVLAQQQYSTASLHSILSDFKKLACYDLIIAGPVAASDLSDREAQNITEFIERRGGGLVILGSNDFNGSILSPSSRLSRLSPAVAFINARSLAGSEQQSSIATGEESKTGKIILAPTREGEQVFFESSGNLVMDSLGPLSDSYLRIKALKPGSVALAVDRAASGAQKPVLIAAQMYGYGRVLLFAAADTWRIKLAEKGETQGEFAALWQNIAFWAESNAEPAINIRLRTSSLEAGDALRAYVTVRDDAFDSVGNLTIKAALDFQSETGKTGALPVMIARDPASPGVYEANTVASDKGKGNLTIELESTETGARSVRISFCISSKKSEWRESIDAGDRLARAAQATGGGMFASDQFDFLKSKLLEWQPENSSLPATHRLRNSVALAFLLPLLMAWEYFLRKRSLGG